MGSSLSSFYFPSSSASPSPPSVPLPPPSPPQIKYDVFLSFRGEDTRYNFISHLHKALNERGINTFIDYNLNRGDEISPALLTAIEESQISVIIFSKNYASSKWCLKELAKILECKNRETNKQIVIPVFYGVTPSDLKNQTGSFADAFAKHEKRFKQNLEQVHRWKDALKEATNLSGWPASSDKSEADLIEVISEDVLQKLDYLSSIDTRNLVGIDSKIKEIESLLCMGTNDVRSVGIWGIGGIGKTTLAEVVFNKISSQFKGSYFARNVRERCEQSNGLNCLQRELLLALLGDKHAIINVYVAGHTFIKNRLSRKKLLIAFDDVSDFRQIESLVGGFDCLGPQSRIIITTRDKQVLENCEMNQVYKVRGLIDHEALKLFHMYAFRRNYPMKDYTELSKRLVKYAGGIPLALKVLGSYLHKKKIEVWESAIEKMERLPHLDIYKVLKISYDGLDSEEQRIFLDVACFFKWSNIEHVKSALEACGFAAKIGIEVLLDKSLIDISCGRITMHDLLEATAKEIVRQESIEDPGKRSRLWDHEEIYHILTKNTCAATIEGIALDVSKIKDDILLNPCDFLKMRRLRILKFYNSGYEEMDRVHTSQGLEYNLAALRYLSWRKCPIKLPFSCFSLENLVIFDMRESKVEQLWNGVLPLAKLKEVDLSYSYLTSCPDFSGSPNLKKLNLFCCKNLCEISPSIGCLKELDFLVLSCCSSLKTIPNFSGLISIKHLYLSGCSNLKTLDEMPCNLETFCLSSWVIEELPLSFLNLSKLQSLRLDDCRKLKRLPSRICRLKSLQILYLDDCSELDQLPRDIGRLSSLKILRAERTAIRELPSSIIDLKKCKLLSFSELEVQDRLQSCDIEWSDPIDVKFKKLSADDWFSTITNLSFDLSNCMMVKCLPKLQLGDRRADNLTVPEVLSSLCFQDCTPLSDFEDIVKKALHALQIIKRVCVLLSYPGSEVPKWFDFQSLGHFINVELLPNWLNQSFIGFALCVVVAPLQQSQKGRDGIKVIKWTCKLKSKDGQSFTTRGLLSEFIFQSNYVLVKSPILPFSLYTLLRDVKEVSFKFSDAMFNQQFYKIEKCGVHLMYAQYIEEVDGSSWVGEDENILSLTNIHNNCKEVDKPHPKRPMKTPN